MAHTFTRCLTHVVFPTSGRAPFLADAIRPDVLHSIAPSGLHATSKELARVAGELFRKSDSENSEAHVGREKRVSGVVTLGLSQLHRSFAARIACLPPSGQQAGTS